MEKNKFTQDLKGTILTYPDGNGIYGNGWNIKEMRKEYTDDVEVAKKIFSQQQSERSRKNLNKVGFNLEGILDITGGYATKDILRHPKVDYTEGQLDVARTVHIPDWKIGNKKEAVNTKTDTSNSKFGIPGLTVSTPGNEVIYTPPKTSITPTSTPTQGTDRADKVKNWISDIEKQNKAKEIISKRPTSTKVAYDNKGMSTDVVKKMQQTLISSGYDLGKGGTDGKWGAKTQAAYEDMNRRVGAEKIESIPATHWRRNQPLSGIGPANTMIKKEVDYNNKPYFKSGGKINFDLSEILKTWTNSK